MQIKKTNRNVNPICYSLYCKQNTIPFYTLLLLGFMGVLLAFIFEYALLIDKNLTGVFRILCINGINIHHSYVGFMIFLGSGIAFLVIKNKQRIWLIFIVGLGFGLVISDIIAHLLFEPFSYYCV